LALQKSDITLSLVNKFVKRQIQIFAARQQQGSDFSTEACTGVSEGTFKGVNVASSSGKQQLIKRAQFYQALAGAVTRQTLTKFRKRT
jgi:hypothetical protein